MASKVPRFGSWDGTAENISYTGSFEKPHIANGRARVVENVPQTKRDMPPRPNPTARAQTAKPERREGRSRVPEFGDRKSGEGGGEGYTGAFNDINKKHGSKSKAPRVVGHPPQGGPTKVPVPQFGDWDGKNDVQYTADFDHQKKPKKRPLGVKLTVPQLNPDALEVKLTELQRNPDVGDKGRPHSATKPTADRDVRDKGQSHPETKSTVDLKEDGMKNASKGSTTSVPGPEHAPRQGKPPSKARLPVDQKGRLRPRTGPTRGNPAVAPGSIPPYGGWHKDRSQSEGYTEAFIVAREERKTPPNAKVPPQSHRKPQEGCCSIL